MDTPVKDPTQVDSSPIGRERLLLKLSCTSTISHSVHTVHSLIAFDVRLVKMNTADA
jgi:hypothetical protein